MGGERGVGMWLDGRELGREVGGWEVGVLLVCSSFSRIHQTGIDTCSARVFKMSDFKALILHKKAFPTLVVVFLLDSIRVF